MLDGRLLETVVLPEDFALRVIGSESEARARNITLANYATGQACYGHAANLKVFGRALNETELAALFSETAAERAILETRHGRRWPLIGVVASVTVLCLVVLLKRLGRRWHSRLSGADYHQTGAWTETADPP